MTASLAGARAWARRGPAEAQSALPPRAASDFDRALTDWPLRPRQGAAYAVVNLDVLSEKVAGQARSEGAGAQHTGPAHRTYEVNRPDRTVRRLLEKSDPLDALAAERAGLSGRAQARATSGDGPVHSAGMYKLAKDSAVKARTQAINQLKAVLVIADPTLRERLSTPGAPLTCSPDSPELRPFSPGEGRSRRRWFRRLQARPGALQTGWPGRERGEAANGVPAEAEVTVHGGDVRGRISWCRPRGCGAGPGPARRLATVPGIQAPAGRICRGAGRYRRVRRRGRGVRVRPGAAGPPGRLS